LHKCVNHKPRQHDGATYYLHELGGVVAGIPKHTLVAGEFQTALQMMGVTLPLVQPATHRALDIGAGIGHYGSWLLRLGYSYEALEPFDWAGKYIEGCLGGPVHRCGFDELEAPDGSYQLIVAGHCLEHLPDARVSLDKMLRLLDPQGWLLILIPDDTDLGNPDHLWFFKERTLTMWLEERDCEVKSVVRSIVPWEKFMYFAARRKAVEQQGV